METYRSLLPGLIRGTADPSATPDFLSRLVASRTPCGFPYRKPHTLPSLALRTGNPGTLGMTKERGALPLRAVAGLKEFFINLGGPTFRPATALQWKRSPPLCHPERSRGICSSLYVPKNCHEKRCYDGRAEISRRWRSKASFPMNSCGT